MIDSDAARAALAADLERVSTGDRHALRRVYERSGPKLFGICFHLLQDAMLAEDALQEVFIKVWQHAGAFDRGRASPITWLSILARNTAIDVARRTRRHADAMTELRQVQATFAPSLALAGVSERDQLLAQCLEALDEHARALLSAAFLEGLTHSELAFRADVPLGTVKGRIRRALVQVRDCVSDG